MAEEKYKTQLQALEEELRGQIPASLSAQDALAYLAGDGSRLDDRLALYVLLKEGSPAGLAPFEELIDELIGSPALLRDMLLADGAKEGCYGRAMTIYKEIQEHRTNTEHAVLDRLALAIALEHAKPILENPTKEWNAPPGSEEIDPVQRYLNYEDAFLSGELDENFHLLDAWNLRMLVDGEEPDEIDAWGRKTLRNFQPNHLFANDEWRYVALVRSDVAYGSGRDKFDKPELQFYQNVLMNGGICGRRAYFGRFILRCFGIPTTARPSKGHGALIHWTKQGWVTCLGPGWGQGWTKTLYYADMDFKNCADARNSVDAFAQVMRARWIGEVMGEEKVYGAMDAEKKAGNVGFWYGAAIQAQKAILDAQASAPQKEWPVSPMATKTQRLLKEKLDANMAKEIMYLEDGTIVIPAAAYTNRNPQGVSVGNSFQDGGLQIFMAAFQPKGWTVLRGGSWKTLAPGCRAGARLLGGGMGKYDDWGFRVALSGPEDPNACPAPTTTLRLGAAGVELEMIYIRPGTFVMGGDRTADDIPDARFFVEEVPKHEVVITRGYYIGKYPVTQAQWEAVMGNNPSRSTRDPNCPVDAIGLDDAKEFCQSFAEGAGGEVRLPTEAEWEYAARAGTSTNYWWGDDEAVLGNHEWWKENSDNKSHPVGQKSPNPWGLYDLHGNILERCSDIYEKDYYANGPREDPKGPSPGISSELEYTIKVRKPGKYKLTVQVVTVNELQRLMVEVDGQEALLEMPFTLGDWGQQSVEVNLKEGENKLRFWRDKPPQYGMAVKAFTLAPAE